MKRMQLLDYGRFFAAIAVITFHYLFNGIQNGKISSITHIPEVIDFVKYGYLGVEFFFMISGFVIFFSAKNRSASQFAVSRAIRLYPAFWTAIIFTSTVAFFWGGELMKVSLSLVLTNLTMISPVFGKGFVDGVYWTLIYELKFYVLVFILLIIGVQKKLDQIFLLWPVVIAFGVYFEKDYLPYLGSYFCFFSAGAILAMLKEKQSFIRYSSLILALYLCISFSTGQVTELIEVKGIYFSELIIGMIVFMFFIFFLVANTKVGSNLNLYGSKLLGGLTYPIYLVHAHFGYMFISQFATEENKIFLYVLTVIVVLLVSYLIHTFVEKKYSTFWKNFFDTLVGKPIDWLGNKINGSRNTRENL